MEFAEICPNYLYAVRFEGKDMNEFDLAFEHWQDPDFLIDFFNENQSLINTDYWKENLPSLNPAELSKAISKEALELENFLKNLARNTSKKRLPDFDTHFKELGGKKI